MRGILGEGDDVLVLLRAADHFLPLDDLSRGSDLIAEQRGALELEVLGRSLHPSGQLRQHELAVPLQEGAQPGDDLPVAFSVHRADARAGAALDVIVEARLGVVAGDLAGAVQVREHAAQNIQRLAHGVGGGKWAIVAAAVPLHAPNDADLGEILVPVQLDVGVGFVVLEPHVEPRPVALDQLIFQDQRFQLGVGDDPFQVGDLAHQPPRLGIPVGLEVRADAVAQHHRLADVDHLPVGRMVEVDPRPLGQGVEFLGKVG